MQIRSIFLVLGALFVGVSSSYADEVAKAAPEKQVETTPKATQQIDLSLLRQSIAGDYEIKMAKKSPIEGLYQVQIGNNIYYLSKDGTKLIDGAMIDLKTQTNLTDVAKREVVKSIVAGVSDEDVITYAAKDPKYTVYAFTDVTCPYCIKLHKDIPEYNKLGITIKYLAFPRNGLGSGVAKDMQAIWCASDRKDAMSRVKDKHEKLTNTCPQIQVTEQYQLGRSLGISGTPALLLPNGDIQPGYVDPDNLIRLLDLAKKEQDQKASKS